MPQRVRVADRFKAQSAEQLLTMAGAILTGLPGNPSFAAPTVDLEEVQGAADGLSAALAAQAHERTAETAEKNKQEVLIEIPDTHPLRPVIGADGWKVQTIRCLGNQKVLRLL